jgi:hypothetical protein
MEVRRRPLEERGLVRRSPDVVGTSATTVETAAARARVGGYKPAIQAPGQNQGEHAPCIVRLAPPGIDGEPVAPCHEDPPRATVGQSRQWKVAEGLLDPPDQRDIAAPLLSARLRKSSLA